MAKLRFSTTHSLKYKVIKRSGVVLARRKNHRCLQGRARLALQQLRTGLQALHRSSRAHRRLVKLAPELFDHALRERMALEEAKNAVWRKEAAAALDRVYGPENINGSCATQSAQSSNAGMCKNSATIVHFSFGAEAVGYSSSRRRAIESHFAERELWLSLGQEAMAAFLRWNYRPRLSLILIARLLEVGVDLARLATGFETTAPPNDPFPQRNLLDDLHRAYGG